MKLAASTGLNRGGSDPPCAAPKYWNWKRPRIQRQTHPSGNGPLYGRRIGVYPLLGNELRLHMMEKVLSLSAGKTKRYDRSINYLEILTKNGVVHSTKEMKVYIQELGTCLSMKSLEDFPSVLSLGRFCDELGCSYSWQPGDNPKSTIGNMTITCCMRSQSKKTLPSLDAIPAGLDPARENLLPGKEAGETM